jgi:hypothetical protein
MALRGLVLHFGNARFRPGQKTFPCLTVFAKACTSCAAKTSDIVSYGFRLKAPRVQRKPQTSCLTEKVSSR